MACKMPVPLNINDSVFEQGKEEDLIKNEDTATHVGTAPRQCTDGNHSRSFRM